MTKIIVSDELATLLDKDSKYKDAIEAGRAVGRAEKAVQSMADAIAAHGEDDELLRAALKCAFISSKTGMSLQRVLSMYPKAAEKSDDYKAAQECFRPYYQRARKLANVASKHAGAGNSNAAKDDTATTVTPVTDRTEAPAAAEKLGTVEAMDAHVKAQLETLVATMKKHAPVTRPGVLLAVQRALTEVEKLLADAEAITAAPKKRTAA